MRAALFALPLWLACAGVPARQEAGPAPMFGPAAAEPAPVPAVAIRPVPTGTSSLSRAMRGFARLSAQSRALHRPGAPMPEGEAENWKAALARVGGYLLQPAAATSRSEVLRAEGLLEAELERDGRTYGEVDRALAEAIQRQQAALAVRAEELRRAERSAAARRPSYGWPLTKVVITSLFGRRMHPLLGRVRAHEGIDLAADDGEPVFAAAGGVVVQAGEDGGYGIRVELRHPDGTRTCYAHLEAALVSEGDKVLAGQRLGLAGSTGLSTGPHLHFELWRRGRARDPLRVLGPPGKATPSS